MSWVALTTCSLLMLACGCSGDASNRESPPRTEPAQKVVYEAPNPGAHKVAVPPAVVASTADPVPLPTLPKLRQGFPMVFEGEFEADGVASAIVTVTFFKRDRRLGKVETNGFNGQATRSEDGAKWTYSLQGKTPESAGVNEIEVSVFAVEAPGTRASGEAESPENRVIARGRIEIDAKSRD